MLPYTPLHHLLLADFGGALVMTSVNRSDEPVNPAGASTPLSVRCRDARRRIAACFHRWSWESRGPVRMLAARTLKSVPLVRRGLLRRLARSEDRDAA